MKKIALILSGLLIVLGATSQVAPNKYFIEFTDKNNSPYSIDRPEEFLTPRSIERRQKQDISVEEADLPVNPAYVDAVSQLGAIVLTRSKWLNGITVYTTNPNLISQIESLSFVKNVVKSMPGGEGKSQPVNKFEEESFIDLMPPFSTYPAASVSSSFNYGISYNQIQMVNGDALHQLGYRGSGKVIAVLDGGFYNVDVLQAFDSLRARGQILGTRDFVVPGNNVYRESTHGMSVLSIMGGIVPGKLIGTAPAASYWLLRPEDVGSEYIIEEYNWVSAAEFADSVGADIINSSLGYTRFDDTTQSHTCADMDGKTTPVTRGANMAVSRGMLVVNSAGNSGGSSWQCVGAPADGISVLAIAAVDSNKVLAGFSSRGVSTTRIKPNVAAMGVMTVLSAPDGTIGRSNGTSFSSPVVAGMVACLWEALPDWSNSNIFRAIELSSSQASHPDSLLGFGIPDFYKAMINISLNEYISSNRLTIFPNPVNDRFTMSHDGSLAGHTVVYILDQMGRVVFTHEFTAGAGEKHHSLKLPDGLSGGCYLIRVVNNENTYVSKMVKR